MVSLQWKATVTLSVLFFLISFAVYGYISKSATNRALLWFQRTSGVSSSPHNRQQRSGNPYSDSTGNRQHSIVIIAAGPTAREATQRLFELRHKFNNTKVIILASSVRDHQEFLWEMGGNVIFSHYDYFDFTLDRTVPHGYQHVRAAFAFMLGSNGKRRFILYWVQNSIEVMDKVACPVSGLSGLDQVTRNQSEENPANFDDWLQQKFGLGLFDVLMRKYNNKVWTVKSTELNFIWVGEPVVVADINKIKASAPAYDKGIPKQESMCDPNRNFRFPSFNDTGSIWKSLAKLIPPEWFKFNTNITHVAIDSKTFFVESGAVDTHFTLSEDILISKATRDVLIKVLEGQYATLGRMKHFAFQLVYTHYTHIVGIGLAGQPPETLSDKPRVYFPDSDSPFYRVTVFSYYSKNYVPDAIVHWSLMCEAAELMGDVDRAFWTQTNVVTATVKALIPYYHRLDHGYPVPSLNRDKVLNFVHAWLEKRHIYSRGRFGGWRYMDVNQDYSFMQRVEVVDRILRGIPEETYSSPNLVNSGKNTGRFLPSREYEFVVAHYNENFDWLKPIANSSYVYHKGNGTRPSFGVFKWETLPNVGREGQTYLHHIIENYDNLANLTIFLQGEGSVPERTCFSAPMDYVVNAKHNTFCKQIGMWTNWNRIEYYGRFQEALQTGSMRRAKLNFGDLYQTLFDTQPPASIPFCLKGCFSASRNNLRRRPKRFYQKAKSFLDNHPNPEEGHYIERLWCTIVHC